MYLFKGTVILVVTSFLSTSWALQCFECLDCGGRDSETKSTCQENEICVKLTMRTAVPHPVVKYVSKSCLQDSISCGQLAELTKTAADEGLVTGRDPIELECAYCETDLCNGVGVVHRGALTAACMLTGLLTLLYILQ